MRKSPDPKLYKWVASPDPKLQNEEALDPKIKITERAHRSHASEMRQPPDSLLYK
jgi:hypothetical protein